MEFHNFADREKRRRRKEGCLKGKRVCFSHLLEERTADSKPLLAAVFFEGGFYSFHAEDCDYYICLDGESGPRLKSVARGTRVLTNEEFAQLLAKTPVKG